MIGFATLVVNDYIGMPVGAASKDVLPVRSDGTQMNSLHCYMTMFVKAGYVSG